jgi:hypothetical protein
MCGHFHESSISNEAFFGSSPEPRCIGPAGENRQPAGVSAASIPWYVKLDAG